MDSPVLKIKERLSIVDVISTYLKVEPAGKNYKAKCPFHNEKTPSFFISTDRGTYYCFGCGAKGDIFSFVENFEGLDFLGAMKILAEKAGIELKTYQNKEKDKSSLYYEIMDEASIFFEKILLTNSDAKNYLLDRGLTEETIKDFRIGYAALAWTNLFDHLLKKGYLKEDIEIVGLTKKKDNRYYDRFRGRIMFPISDSSGRIIAFSGRLFKNETSTIEEAKYLNSPDTPLFNKSNVLFGLSKAKAAIRSRDYSIIVEGQFDLILSHQAGFTNTVAVSGTAFTDSTLDHQNKINNLGLVRRLSNNIIFAYDGDEAGIRAASRSAMIALSLDMQVKVAVLPIGQDPADLIKANILAWKDIIKNSVNIISFHLDRICQAKTDLRLKGKQIREIIFPFLRIINSSIERSAYIQEIKTKTGISEVAILDDFEKYLKGLPAEVKVIEKIPEIKVINTRRQNLEKRLFGIFFWQGDNPEHKKVIDELRQNFEQDIGADAYKNILDLYEPISESLSFEAEMWYGNKIEALINDTGEMILNLEEEILSDEANTLLTKINQKEQNKDKNDFDSDLKHYQSLVEKIQIIKNRRSK